MNPVEWLIWAAAYDLFYRGHFKWRPHLMFDCARVLSEHAPEALP